MSLLRSLGGWSIPLVQFRRQRDGVRGLVSRKACRSGDVLLTIPLKSCLWPKPAPSAWRGAELDDWTRREAHRMIRRNAGPRFPGCARWLSKLSPVAEPRVQLVGSASDNFGGMDDEDDEGLRDSRSRGAASVLSVYITPVEAALALEVALRYFWRHIAFGGGGSRASCRAALAEEQYISALPLGAIMSAGVEALYLSTFGGDGRYLTTSSQRHACVEQVSLSLRDVVLEIATSDEYRAYDARASDLDSVLCAALYLVRSRVLWLPLVGSGAPAPKQVEEPTRLAVIQRPPQAAKGVIAVIAPVIDMLNHDGCCFNCTAAVMPDRQEVVVWACTNIRCGEELLLCYHSGPELVTGFEFLRGSNGSYEHSSEAWEGRYLLPSESMKASL